MKKSAKYNKYKKKNTPKYKSFKSDLATGKWLDVFNESNADMVYKNCNNRLQIYYD